MNVGGFSKYKPSYLRLYTYTSGCEVMNWWSAKVHGHIPAVSRETGRVAGAEKSSRGPRVPLDPDLHASLALPGHLVRISSFTFLPSSPHPSTLIKTKSCKIIQKYSCMFSSYSSPLQWQTTDLAIIYHLLTTKTRLHLRLSCTNSLPPPQPTPHTQTSL